MTSLKGPCSFSKRASTFAFSLLAILVVLITPLLSAQPVSADWGPDIQLTDAAGNSEIPAIAVSDNSVHVVWQDMRDGNYEIYYKRSLDGGITWGPDVRLTDAVGNSKSPSIAVSGNTVHVVWFDSRSGPEEIFYRRSTDGGASWMPETRLSSCPGTSGNPSIAVTGNVVHAVWYNNDGAGNVEIYYKRSTDGGTSWEPDFRLTDCPANSYTPSIAVAGDNVHVAWHDSRDGNEEIYYIRSTDGGTSWGADTRLSFGAESSCFAAIAVYGNYIHIAWQDYRHGNWEIYYDRSTDGGTTWGGDTRLTNNGAHSFAPSIAVAGTNVHVVWEDWRIGWNQKVFYKHSTDGGGTWSADAKLVNTSRLSSYPSITATPGDYVHVAWQDNSGALYPIWDIFYKRYVPPPPPGITSATVNTGLGTVSFNINAGSISGLTNLASSNLLCSAPSGYIFPYSMFSFNITGLTAGQQVAVTIRFPGTLPSGARYYKCVNGNLVDCTHLVTRVDDYTIILRLTDGGSGDADGIANGSIVDPGGPAVKRNNPPSSHQSSIPAAPQAPVSLSNIIVRSASLSAAKVAPGAPVTVTASIVNTGSGNGTSVVKVYVNGSRETQQGVTVNSGGATQVSFDIVRNEPGTYTVNVGGVQAGSFTVDQAGDPNMILYISSALLFFAFIIGILFILKRKTTT